jgi:hypothetical protein
VSLIWIKNKYFSAGPDGEYLHFDRLAGGNSPIQLVPAGRVAMHPSANLPKVHNPAETKESHRTGPTTVQVGAIAFIIARYLFPGRQT